MKLFTKIVRAKNGIDQKCAPAAAPLITREKKIREKKQRKGDNFVKGIILLAPPQKTFSKVDIIFTLKHLWVILNLTIVIYVFLKRSKLPGKYK